MSSIVGNPSPYRDGVKPSLASALTVSRREWNESNADCAYSPFSEYDLGTEETIRLYATELARK